VNAPTLSGDQADRFNGSDNCSITTREPVLKAALLELAAAYPNSLPFKELYERSTLRVLAQGGAPDPGTRCTAGCGTGTIPAGGSQDIETLSRTEP